jgi:hypothetical protein
MEDKVFELEDAPLTACMFCGSPYVKKRKSTPSDKEIYLIDCAKCNVMYLLDKENNPNIITKF